MSRARWARAGVAAAIYAVAGLAPPTGGPRAPHSSFPSAPDGRSRPSDGAPCPVNLDCGHWEPLKEELENLLLHERHDEAFQRAVAELRARVRQKGPLASETLICLQWTGAIAYMAGDLRTAEDTIEALLPLRRRQLGPDDVELADVLLWGARVARKAGRSAEAKARMEEARGIVARCHDARRRASLEAFDAARLLHEDLSGSIAHRCRALALEQQWGRTPQTATILTWLGWCLDRDGKMEEAKPYILEARAQLEALGLQDNMLYATVQQLLADQLAYERRWPEAEAHYRVVASTLAGARMYKPGGFGRRTIPLDGYLHLALAALQRGDGEEAWNQVQRGRAPLCLDFARLASWDRIDPIGFREVSARKRRLLEDEQTLEARRRAGGDFWDPPNVPLSLDVLALRAEIGAREAGFLRDHELPPPSLARVRAMLDDRTALLGRIELHVGGAITADTGPRRTWIYAYVLRRNAPVRWVKLWEGTYPARNDPRWTPTAMATLWHASAWPEPVTMDEALYDELRSWGGRELGPFLPHLEGIDRLVVEGGEFPYEVMRCPDGRYLLDRFEILYIPAACLLPLLEEGGRTTRRAPRSILAA